MSTTRKNLKRTEPVAQKEPLTEAQELDLLSDIRSKQSAAKSANLFVGGAIFFDYLQRYLGGSVGATSRYLFFPLTIALSFVNNLYLARQIRSEQILQGKANPGTIANFAIELTTSTLVAIALIGGAIAQSALFVLATPVMLLVSVGSKAVWDAVKGVANIAKAVRLESVNRTDVEEYDRKESYKNGMYNLASAALTALITVSIGLIMLSTGLAIYAAVGFAAGMVGSLATMVAKADRSTVSIVERAEVVKPVTVANEDSLSSTASMNARLHPTNVKTVNFGRSYYDNNSRQVVESTSRVHNLKRLYQPAPGVSSVTLDEQANTVENDASRVVMSARRR